MIIFVLATIGISALLAIIKFLQHKFPSYLPDSLRTFDFLPEALRSLKPYDNILSKLKFSKCFNDNLNLTKSIEDTHIKQAITVTFSNEAFNKDNI